MSKSDVYRQSNRQSYLSRRLKNYDDNISDDEGVEEFWHSKSDQGAIRYHDTTGSEYKIKPNMKFNSYQNNFTDLIKQ